MKLVECIGNTWQGEGPDSGRKMTLVRFRECDRVENGRACSWCDTLVKMRVMCEADYNIQDINTFTKQTGGLMISGGEPTFEDNLNSTIELITTCDYEICNIETNGYNITELISRINKSIGPSNSKRTKIMYSPKFFTVVEYQEEVGKIQKVIENPMVYLKFVDDGTGLVEDALAEVKDMKPRKDQIWIMPQGRTAKELIHNSAGTMDIVEKYDANFSSRDHIIYSFI